MKKDTENIQKELEELSPLLRQLQSRETGMQTPPDYFEGLQDQLFQKIEQEGWRPAVEPAPRLQAQRGGRFRYFVGIAAVLGIGLSAWWFMRQQSSQTVVAPDYQAMASALTPEDAQSYVLENIQDFDESTLRDYAVAALDEPSPAHPIEKNASGSHNNQAHSKKLLDELNEDELNVILDDISEEELQEIL